MGVPKRKRKEASRIRMPKAAKSMPVVRRKKKFQFPSLFKKKQSKFPTRRKPLKSIKYLLIPLLFILLSGFVYLTVKYVLILRENAYGDNTDYIITDVLGLEGIPQYPGSAFIFTNNMEDPVVKDFLAGGNSAYRVQKGVTIEEIEEYYFELLPDLGWEFIQSVPIGTGDRKYGQYWIKDESGLRIYSKFRDIWYETITEEDARTALAYLVKNEIEREMLMASSEKQDLLPDFPWRIQIPKEYIIKYSPTDMKDLRAVSFQKLGSEDIVEIFPVGYWKAKELDFMLNDYCEIKSTDEIEYGVLNSVPISFRDTLGLKSTIAGNDKNLVTYTIANTSNSVVYVFSSTSENDPLLDYIIENVKPLGVND